MATGFDFAAFDRLTDPIFRLLTPEQTRAIAELRADERLAQRIDELAAKCSQGQLTEDERAEYEAYASANHLVGLMQAKARRQLNESPRPRDGSESIDEEEIAAARRLKMKTPPNAILLELTRRATVPQEIEDVQEERPW